jgi:uncharacterized protein (DUF924 family)
MRPTRWPGRSQYGQSSVVSINNTQYRGDQERGVALVRASGDEEGLPYAQDHAEIIRRFGRFPHRNLLLGRATTAEEQAFLDAGGFAG